MIHYHVHVYPKELEAHCKFNSKYIPRSINRNEELNLYHKYWVKDLKEIFKVTKIEEYFKNQYYYLEGRNTNQLYTFPLVENEFYEIMINDNDILHQDIINSNESYKGYLIKYWFFKKSSKKYKEFEKYISYTSDHSIDDNKSYKIEATKIKNSYHNCKIICS